MLSAAEARLTVLSHALSELARVVPRAQLYYEWRQHLLSERLRRHT